MLLVDLLQRSVSVGAIGMDMAARRAPQRSMDFVRAFHPNAAHRLRAAAIQSDRNRDRIGIGVGVGAAAAGLNCWCAPCLHSRGLSCRVYLPAGDYGRAIWPLSLLWKWSRSRSCGRRWSLVQPRRAHKRLMRPDCFSVCGDRIRARKSSACTRPPHGGSGAGWPTLSSRPSCRLA